MYLFTLIVIFILEVVFTFLPNFLDAITSMISKSVFQVTDDERSVRSEIKDLKEEQSQLSMTDEFARYARLQRQIDKLMLQIKEKGGERKQNTAYLRMGISAGIHVLHALIVLTMMITLRSNPLMQFPVSWVSPFTKVIAFPTGIPGALGIGCWVVVSKSVISRVKNVAGL